MSRYRLAVAAAVLPLLVSCMDMSQLPHGNLPMPDMSGGPGFSNNAAFNGKNYADPNPHSASDDAQRAAYQQHQQEQMNAAGMNSGPDLGHMNCTGSSVSSSGANAGTYTASSNCHN
jgi:hypothetical protein